MAAIWKGALSFGLVNIPVALQSAVRRSESISFRQLDSEDLTPIKQQRINANTGEVVPWERIVKGYEISKDTYVVMTSDDFSQAALPSSKTIDVLAFVAASEVDPRFYETPYYLVPDKSGQKAYALLREAVRESEMLGIGKITLRSNSQHLAAVHVVDNALMLSILRYGNEVIGADEYAFPDKSDIKPQELKMAEQLISNLAEPFDPNQYEDEYRRNLQQIIDAKSKNETVSFTEQTEPEATRVIDLVARLKESLEKTGNGASKTRKGASKRTSGSGSSKPASRAKSGSKSATKKARKTSQRRSA
ncbi:MAG TPA: Ku protein [Gemmatimonadales bacterium]|nr:Ku protein [Gemmatimonadales bacterium]